MNWLTRAALIVVSLPLVLSPTAVSADAAAPWLTTGRSEVFLSPDGDGRADTATVMFHLARKASVKIEVLDSRLTVRHLGTTIMKPGRHALTWDGRDDRGNTLEDGAYRIKLTAETVGGAVEKRVFLVHLDVDGDHGRLYTSRATVYPQATAVSDRVLLVYLREGWDPVLATDAESLEAAQQLWMPLRVVVAVRDGSGRTVWRESQPAGLATSIAWDGRTSRGRPAGVGSYEVRVRVTDAARNRTSYGTAVRVSHRQLSLETLTTTYDAASAPTYDRPRPVGCTECPRTCSPGPSLRYPDGLSFGDCAEQPWEPPTFVASTLARFAGPVPFAAAPVDSYRVTASGGPPTPGGTGSGALEVGSTQQPMGPGDVTITTPWTPVSVDTIPFLPHLDLAASWSFSTTTGYDLESFTLEYQHYVPVP